MGLVRCESHWSVSHKRFNPLNWEGKGSTNEHGQNDQTKDSIIIHHPQKYWEYLKEGKRVDDLISEYTLKGSYRYLKNIIIIKLLLLFFDERFGHDVPYEIVL